MGKRYNYRNDYKGWSNEKIKGYLPYLKDKLLRCIGISDELAENYLKRICYLKNKKNNLT